MIEWRTTKQNLFAMHSRLNVRVKWKGVYSIIGLCGTQDLVNGRKNFNNKTMTNWNEIAAEHHAAMVEKGFHDNYSHTDLLLRGIEEVGEAAKAWRKNMRVESMPKYYMEYHDGGLNAYDNNIKGTIEEELADIALIMLDFAATNDFYIDPKNTTENENVCDILMDIAGLISNIRTGMQYEEDADRYTILYYINWVFTNLEKLAKGLNIDLEEQVRLKMQYNKTRPHKHGDKN